MHESSKNKIHVQVQYKPGSLSVQYSTLQQRRRAKGGVATCTVGLCPARCKPGGKNHTREARERPHPSIRSHKRVDSTKDMKNSS